MSNHQPSIDKMNTTKSRSILSGVMITAGTAIGAGMLSLPVVSSGMWFIFSLLSLFVLWFLNYLSALYILEANVQFAPGASFDTITRSLLGKRWNIFIGVSIAFLMYILLYAYFSAFGNMVTQTLGLDVLSSSQWMQGLMSLSLGAVLAFLVWLSTAAVGRISTVLVFGMIISFIISMSGFALRIDVTNLFDTTGQGSSYFPYLWAALPYFMTSFGFATVVPSLYKFYGQDTASIKRSLVGGSLLVLLVYVLFLAVVFGNISRQDFIIINQEGGNIGQLVDAFNKDQSSNNISFVLSLFSNFAIITSFLGVGLGLFDYIADKFSLSDDRKGRFKTALITFLPAGTASFFFPDGFIAAIGFAGLVCVIGFFVAPFAMILKVRKTVKQSIYRVWGGHKLLFIFIISSLLVGVCQILAMMKFLPRW